MSLAILGWVLFGSAIVISALLIYPVRSKVSRRQQLDQGMCKARLEDIRVQRKLDKISEGEVGAGAARLALLARRQTAGAALRQALRNTGGTLIVPAAVFLLVASVGSTISYVGTPSDAIGSGHTMSPSLPASGPDSEVIGRLKDYTRSIAAEAPASAGAAGKLLPDVDTMIERLAARLKTTPDDIRGWRMLGWSYSHTGHYEQAASAFARAVELDPDSPELRLSYEEAKAKAAENRKSEAASNSQASAVVKEGDTRGVGQMASFDAVPAREPNAAIRSMVDGLADRLENSPRDVEGWTRLMRSRIVLGEGEAAVAAFRKALEVFKGDPAASGKITAAAIELGLKAE